MQLHRLFQQGLANDFDYFPDDYRAATAQANSRLRLLLASYRPSRLILTAAQYRRLVGYAIAGLQPASQSPRQAFLYWVYVDPARRDHGIGRQLMTETLANLKRRQMKVVRLATHNYVDYYHRYGFVSQPEQSFSIGPTKMYIMELQL